MISVDSAKYIFFMINSRNFDLFEPSASLSQIADFASLRKSAAQGGQWGAKSRGRVG